MFEEGEGVWSDLLLVNVGLSMLISYVLLL